MNYKMLKCENCGNTFIWSIEEQQLYQKRNLTEPKYCAICRGIMEAREKDQNRTRMENKNIDNQKGKL